jgi:transcriptional regulator with XRE-family HTH domain
MGSKKPDLIDVEVGQRIRIQRLAAGLSQSELAERIGVTFQQVQKYEKGMNRVGAGRLTKIARVLNVPIGSFFDGREEIEQVELQGFESPLAAMAQPYAYRLLRAYAAISDPDLRQTIVEFVERTANQSFVGGARSERPPPGRH